MFKYLVSDLTTQMRLSDCTPPPAFEARDEYAAQHPFQHMYRDDGIQDDVSKEIRRAFKADLVVHMAGGDKIPVYIGDKPDLESGEHRVSRTYLDRVEKLARLEDQGDGVRSFVSIVSRVITESRSIQLIDEPEAFLHPPQAKLIGEIIAEKSEGRQTFISTHSSNLIQGLLSSGTSRISIVRLTRRGSVGTARHLESSAIEALWQNPILQFSDVLSGIFHDAVVVTEADADCRFYESMSFATVPADGRLDVHYVYSGGKDRISTIVAALTGLDVPVVAIVDFDVLNSETPLRNIVEAYGADWDEFSSDWKTVKTAVESKATFLGSADFKKQTQELLSKIGTDLAVSKQILADMRKLTRRASPWDHVKMSGVAAIPSGEPTKATKRLLANLKQLGIFVVPNGEMEGFCREVGGHGPRWVEQVLERDLANDEDLQDARTFVSSVHERFRDRLEAAAAAATPLLQTDVATEA